LGVGKIWISGYTPAPIDRFGRDRSDFNKVALGTEKIIDWEIVDESIMVFLERLKYDGYEVVGLEQGSGSVLLREYNPSSSILLIPGTETTGLDSEIQNLCDNLIEIEQVGSKESLNVHSATAIALWKLML